MDGYVKFFSLWLPSLAGVALVALDSAITPLSIAAVLGCVSHRVAATAFWLCCSRNQTRKTNKIDDAMILLHFRWQVLALAATVIGGIVLRRPGFKRDVVSFQGSAGRCQSAND